MYIREGQVLWDWIKGKRQMILIKLLNIKVKKSKPSLLMKRKTMIWKQKALEKKKKNYMGMDEWQK